MNIIFVFILKTENALRKRNITLLCVTTGNGTAVDQTQVFIDVFQNKHDIM